MQRPQFNTPLVWSLLFVIVAVLAILMMLPPLAKAAFSGESGATQIQEQLAKLMTEHDNSLQTYRDRFNGRSVFFEPKAPASPRRETIETTRTTAPPPPPPPAPSGPPPYSGPTMKGMIGEQILFPNDLRVSVGEEKDGLRVLSTDPPWTAKVEYGGWEYDLELFPRTSEEMFFKRSPLLSSSVPGLIEAPPEEEDSSGNGEAEHTNTPQPPSSVQAQADEQQPEQPSGGRAEQPADKPGDSPDTKPTRDSPEEPERQPAKEKPDAPPPPDNAPAK